MRPEDIIKVEEDDPRRCQAVTKFGQCSNLANEEFNLCPIHICAHNSTIKKRQNSGYDLTRWRAKVQGYAEDEKLTDLRQEIGILRMVLERILESCQSSVDLVLRSNQITDTVKGVQRLVADCHRIEKFGGKYLDKNAILQIGGNIVEIIAERVEDPAVVEDIANEIAKMILNTTPHDETLRE